MNGANVRYWHLADIGLCAANVCFWGKNGHQSGAGFQQLALAIKRNWVQLCAPDNQVELTLRGMPRCTQLRGGIHLMDVSVIGGNDMRCGVSVRSVLLT